MAGEERGVVGVLEAVVDYWERGWAVIDWPVGKKGTTEKWAKKEYDDVRVLRTVFGDNQKNIGVKLGKFSKSLVDLDLDCEEAVVLADRFLPKTSAIFGRLGNPRSHRLYYAEGAKFREFAVPKTGSKKEKLLELRATGQQTIFPPSVHPTGEHYEWYEEDEPPTVEPAVLERACRTLATAVVLTRTLPDRGDGRHHFLLPAVGFLLGAGRLDQNTVADLLKAAGDTNRYSDEAERREWHAEVDRAVKDTAAKLEAGTPVQGGGELEKQLPGVTEAIAKQWGWEKGNQAKPTDDELSDRWLARSADERAYGLVGSLLNVAGCASMTAEV